MDQEEYKPAVSISLMVAAFCTNCNQIVDRLDTCPVCQSHSLLSLARVLNRSVA